MRVRCTTKGCVKKWDPVREAYYLCEHAEEGKIPAVIPDVTYVLVAQDPLLAHAFASHFQDQAPFKGMSKVEVIHGDLFANYAAMEGGPERGVAVVSPANSFGKMDGGIDQKYLDHFGLGLQHRVNEAYARVGGLVPVGQAVIVPTSDMVWPYLISAPTMVLPSDVHHTWNAYWAMKAVLQAVHEWNLEDVYMGSPIAPIKQKQIERVYVPGLCTGTGRMHPDTAARQMRRAYAEMELRGTGL